MVESSFRGDYDHPSLPCELKLPPVVFNPVTAVTSGETTDSRGDGEVETQKITQKSISIAGL